MAFITITTSRMLHTAECRDNAQATTWHSQFFRRSRFAFFATRRLSNAPPPAQRATSARRISCGKLHPVIARLFSLSRHISESFPGWWLIIGLLTRLAQIDRHRAIACGQSEPTSVRGALSTSAGRWMRPCMPEKRSENWAKCKKKTLPSQSVFKLHEESLLDVPVINF